ncbi:MAG: alpha-glucan family phosphorylase [Gemmatimonadales bacterium]|nr:MAG: alpha-glucan family phosphorylase [Gemmatimonadales bacterium]
MTDAVPHPDEALRIAAFTMEIGLESDIPTYSGGLGILAGDTARAAADLGLPFGVVTLVHRVGYFRQSLDEEGLQSESPDLWSPEDHLRPLEPRVHVEVEGRHVSLRGWEYQVTSANGRSVPVYLLDTDVEENTGDDRRITDELYGGDKRRRLQQELILGRGGVKLLRALGHDRIETFHMNEGHSAFLVMELLSEEGADATDDPAALERAVEAVRRRCVFTTHTPVPEGHDRFSLPLIREVVGAPGADLLEAVGCAEADEVNLTHVALRFSRFTNGVAFRHARLSAEMFPGHRIHAITNGVHAATWTGDSFQRLFDRHLPGWRQDPFLLRHAVAIPLDEIRKAHGEAKATLLKEVERRTGRTLAQDRLTLVFARRATPYKRADLPVSRPEQLLEMARRTGGLQILYAGKAHPNDEAGKEMIRLVVRAGQQLGHELPLVYLEDYDMELARLLVSGADVWLNKPRKPLEASGTSGMKAALNGVPCLSILDGWWIEGHVEGITGWAIDQGWEIPSDDEAELLSLVQKLERSILPLYHRDPDGWARVMRFAVALNGSHFHTRRMMQEYVERAYRV